MIIYQSQHILAIKAIPERESLEYKISPEKRLFGIKIISSYITDFSNYCKYKMPKNHYIKNDKIYELPHIWIKFVNNQTVIIYMDSVDKCKDLVAQLLSPQTKNFQIKNNTIEINVI